jgi:hypothetical protein
MNSIAGYSSFPPPPAGSVYDAPVASYFAWSIWSSGASDIRGSTAHKENRDLRIHINVYPQPGSKGVTIDLSSGIQSNRLYIFNIRGKLVRSLAVTEGKILWDGANASGQRTEPGVYFIKLHGYSEGKRIIISN